MIKFEIDQHVWIKNGVFEPFQGVIVEIQPFYGETQRVKVNYQKLDEFKSEWFFSVLDNKLFKSKEDLLKSLKQDLEWLQHTVNKLEN